MYTLKKKDFMYIKSTNINKGILDILNIDQKTEINEETQLNKYKDSIYNEYLNLNKSGSTSEIQKNFYSYLIHNTVYIINRYIIDISSIRFLYNEYIENFFDNDDKKKAHKEINDVFDDLQENIKSLIDESINLSSENNNIDICFDFLKKYLDLCFNELLFNESLKKFKNNNSFIDKVANKYSEYKNIYNINQKDDAKEFIQEDKQIFNGGQISIDKYETIKIKDIFNYTVDNTKTKINYDDNNTLPSQIFEDNFNFKIEQFVDELKKEKILSNSNFFEVNSNANSSNENILNFENNKYVYSNKNINETKKIIDDNNRYVYSLKDDISYNKFLYFRVKNDADVEIFKDKDNNAKDIKNKDVLREYGKSEENLVNYYILLDSILNRFKIFLYNLNKTDNDVNNSININNRWVTKGFIFYYKTILDKIYNEYLIPTTQNYKESYKQPFKSLASSIIIYKSLFSVLDKNLQDTDYINLQKLDNYFPPLSQFFKFFYIEIKDFLDEYKATDQTIKVSLFCNINDIDEGFFNYIYKGNDLKKIKKLIPYINNTSNTSNSGNFKRVFAKKKDSNSNYDVLEINSNKSINNNPTSNCNNEPNKPINFNKIFERTSNDVMSSYVSISNLIDNLEGVMLFTFGYSGVGKSFTLFGGNGKLGLLQSIVNSIKGINEIDVKIYEMYGLGFYNEKYWKNGDKVYNKYIGYRWKNNNIDEGDVLDKFEYLNNFKYTLKLKNSDDDEISNFFLNLGEITEQIEDKRRTGFKISDSDDVIKTIKPTLNNPDSSRSILVYEFYIYKDLGQNNKVKVPFVVIDLPGKELIINSYGDIGKQSLTENLTGYEIKITPDDADQLIDKMSINKSQQSTDNINDSTFEGDNININIGSDSGESISEQGGYLKEEYQENIKETNKIIFSSTINADKNESSTANKKINDIMNKKTKIEKIKYKIKLHDDNLKNKIKKYLINDIIKTNLNELEYKLFHNIESIRPFTITKQTKDVINKTVEKQDIMNINNIKPKSGLNIFSEKGSAKGIKMDDVIYDKNDNKSYYFFHYDNLVNSNIEVDIKKNENIKIADENDYHFKLIIDRTEMINRLKDLVKEIKNEKIVFQSKKNENDIILYFNIVDYTDKIENFNKDQIKKLWEPIINNTNKNEIFNIPKYLGDIYSKNKDEQTDKLIKEIGQLYNNEGIIKKYNIESNEKNILSEIIKNYKSFSLTEQTGKDNREKLIKFMKEYFEKIFEGIYINENIIGIMNLLLNKKNIKRSPISEMEYSWENNNINYDESNIFYKVKGDEDDKGFDKTIIYENFYKHYLGSEQESTSNAETAKIENLYAFFVTANISKNQKIKDALIKNANKNNNTRDNYIDELCGSQIKMFKDFEEILHAINN